MNLNFSLLLPEMIALGTLVLMTAGEIFQPNRGKSVPVSDPVWNLGFLGALLTLCSLFPYAGKLQTAFGDTVILDPLAVFFKMLFAGMLVVLMAMSREFFQNRKEKAGEFLLLLWTSLIGLFFLVSSNELLLLFVALETAALSFYVMAGYLKKDKTSVESGLKYLVLGSLASALIIYGISLLYVACGSTSMPVIQKTFSGAPHNPVILLGALLILSGFLFKVASVPFQFWVPDVYEGAPAPLVAYLAVGSKAAGFAVLLRLLFTVFTPFDSARTLLFSVLAALTLVYGNLGALVQKNIKRLFGYSSIGHAGYLLIGLAVGKEVGTSALLYYLMAYAFSNLAAFFVITIAGRELGSDRILAYRGLGKRSPFLAGILFLSLLSLAGVPPLAGFFGKFLILLSAVNGGLNWIALLGVLGVAVSLYYYLNLVRVMYFEDPLKEEEILIPLLPKALMILLAAGIVITGFWQQPFLSFALSATRSLF